MQPPTTSTRAPSERETEKLRVLLQTFVRGFGLLVTRQTPCGHPVSPSYAHALMELLERSRSGGATTQSDLGAALGIDKSNVARLCAKMEASGHAAQTRGADDARSRVVELTASGARLARRIEQSSRDRFARVLRGIAPDQRSGLFESLEALNAAVGALAEEPEEK
jgi:DNA-binding MarR family transcriptional regulator